MKRTRLNKIGKQGKRNLDANKKIAELWMYHSIDYCEADFLHECCPFLTNAHRHKRSWYYSQPELLYSYSQVARLCTVAHATIEVDADMTEELFIRLRGE